MTEKLLAAAIQILGVVLVGIGAFMIETWLGFIVLGALIIALGVAIERGT